MAFVCLSVAPVSGGDAGGLIGSEQSFSKEVDDKANSYFQAIYNRGMSVDRLLDELKKFKESPNKKERVCEGISAINLCIQCDIQYCSCRICTCVCFATCLKSTSSSLNFLRRSCRLQASCLEASLNTVWLPTCLLVLLCAMCCSHSKTLLPGR